MAKKSPQRTITIDDLAAAERLKQIWDKRKAEARDRGESFTQQKAADAFNMTQGAVGQYLLGKAALGIKATLQFAQYLGVPPADIRPELGHLASSLNELEPDALELLSTYTLLAPKLRADVLRHALTLAETSGVKEPADSELDQAVPAQTVLALAGIPEGNPKDQKRFNRHIEKHQAADRETLSIKVATERRDDPKQRDALDD